MLLPQVAPRSARRLYSWLIGLAFIDRSRLPLPESIGVEMSEIEIHGDPMG